MAVDNGSGSRIGPYYFENVLAVEFVEIARRRKLRPNGLHRDPVAPNPPSKPAPIAEAQPTAVAEAGRHDRRRSPDPETFFAKAEEILTARAGREPRAIRRADEAKGSEGKAEQESEEYKQRPMPLPCDATGLALSGGGVRSAAIGLGVLQALNVVGRLGSFDYISTVSGGGYVGATLSAGLAMSGKPAAKLSPLGGGIEDSPAVAHLRDYSNYLLPRGRSAVQNLGDVAAVLLRGLVANGVHVLAVLLFLALATRVAYPALGRLEQGNYLASLAAGLVGQRWLPETVFGAHPFGLTKLLWWFLTMVLVVWAIARSAAATQLWSDANGRAIRFARRLVVLVAVSAFLDLQPLAIHAFAVIRDHEPQGGSSVEALFVRIFSLFGKGGGMGGASLVAFATAMSASAHWLGPFLTASQSAKDWTTFAQRIAARLAIFVAAMVLPLALWGAYLYLSATLVGGRSWLPDSWAGAIFGFSKETVSRLLPPIAALVALILCAIFLDGNAYSLHRFYRDRLSRAFLFWIPANGGPEAAPLDTVKLSDLKQGAGPYPIINSALNVQGSAIANKRGRNADFFMFTPDFVGSDLTFYAPTRPDESHPRGMEDAVPALDFATAVAISGAAVSANMGSSTVRLLSPTLALLNLRLGYWLRNPRDFVVGAASSGAVAKSLRYLVGKVYLFFEMINLLDETRARVYLTDGGHIENLGLYELLKRGCKLIVVVDAEADPGMSFGALQIVQRYARIDFGVRINLPWEAIASRTRAVDAGSAPGSIDESSGPHCAVGRILYADGPQGVLLYVKSSLTGDEQDYILDYKKRHPAFPHETTGDQFFTEEQFEAYRALGFHMVEHFFDQEDDFGYVNEGDGAFGNPQEARAAIDYALPGLRRHP